MGAGGREGGRGAGGARRGLSTELRGSEPGDPRRSQDLPTASVPRQISDPGKSPFFYFPIISVNYMKWHSVY